MGKIQSSDSCANKWIGPDGFATVRDRCGKRLMVLMTVVDLLQLLACVNIASMLLAPRRPPGPFRTSGGVAEMRSRARVFPMISLRVSP